MRFQTCLSLLLAIGSIVFCSQQTLASDDEITVPIVEHRIAVLNGLRNEINATYGFKDGVPRINFGPCGPFAKAFREQWNARFKEKINIVFLMGGTPPDSFCCHVLVKLPDGSYFDGGNGVVTDRTLQLQFPGVRIEEMKEFDLKTLDKNSGGLNRDYPNCPNYSASTTTKLIESYLAMLPKDIE